MKVEVKKVDSTKRELNIEVSGDIVKNKFEEVFKNISKEAKISGFRPGNAPRDLIEKHYGHTIHEQVLRELVPDVYSQAVKKEGLSVIELPQITEVKLDNSMLSFRATVETSPEIAVKDYLAKMASYKKISVAADEIKRNLDSLKEQNKIDTIDDNFVRGLGYPNLADLEKAIESQIFLQKSNQQRQKIENEVVESITKDLNFKIPESLVDRQLEDLLRQAKLDLVMKGYPRDKVDGQEAELKKHLEPEARKQVKNYLVLSEIAKKENIAIDDHMPQKVIEFLLREANWQEAA